MRWYTRIPETLFRLSLSGSSKLRQFTARNSTSYDIVTTDKLVIPLSNRTEYIRMSLSLYLSYTTRRYSLTGEVEIFIDILLYRPKRSLNETDGLVVFGSG